MTMTARILCDRERHDGSKCNRALVDFFDDAPPILRVGRSYLTAGRMIVECGRCHREYRWKQANIGRVATLSEGVRVGASRVNSDLYD